MKKKAFALTMAAVMAAASLAGCGSAGEETTAAETAAETAASGDEAEETTASGDEAEARELAGRSSAELVKLNVIKDVSDSAAAMDIGRERGYRLFYFYGCTGGRLDHTLASIQDLAKLASEGCEAYLFDEKAAVTAIDSGSRSFPGYERGFISVFSFTEKAEGVWEKGLKYELEDAELCSAFPLGLSNEFIGEKARISVRKGQLIIYFQIGR